VNLGDKEMDFYCLFINEISSEITFELLN